jgi:hypothetical protein
MTQDEIIEMARQAGLHRYQHIFANKPAQYKFTYDGTEETLIAFAKLAFEKGRIQGMQQEHALWKLSKTSQEIGY